MSITKKINYVFKPASAIANIAIVSAVLLFSYQDARAFGISYDENGVMIRLTKEVEDAIDGGISLTFKCEFAHVDRFLFLTWPEQIKLHKFVVTRHALSNRYLVHQNEQWAPRIFSSKNESLNFISSQSMDLFLKYHTEDELRGERSHEMRLWLSKTELPAPLRLSAFITKEWDLDSGWKAWESAR